MNYQIQQNKKQIYTIIITVFITSLFIFPTILSESTTQLQHKTISNTSKIGILIINYGEPTTFTDETYEDFKAYMNHMLHVGMLPSFLKNIDKGTILTDMNADSWSLPWNRELINAWGKPVLPFALYSPGIEKMHTSPHYFLPFFGPGFGEADIYEQATLTAYQSWKNMDNYSPYKDHTVPQINNVIDQLKETYAENVSCTIGFGFEKGSIAEATTYLIDQDINVLIAAPQMVVDSDFEGDLHWYKEIHETLDSLDLDIPVHIAKQIGSQSSFVQSIVLKTKEKLAELPEDAQVSLLLSNHGFPPVTCGSYDCGLDSYHANAKEAFNLVKDAITENITEQNLLEIKQIYAEFAEGSDDPNNQVLSPLEALNRLPSTCTHVINIPYGFIGETTDTLNALRDAFGVEGWNEEYETIYKYDEVTVTITSCKFHDSLREEALFESIADEIEKIIS